MKKILLSIFSIVIVGLLSAQDLSVAVGTVSSEETGIEVEVPFYVSGFNGDYAVTAMEFYIDFDSTLADYVEVRNIYSGTQPSEWFFTAPPTNRFACNWVQGLLQSIDIPDSTKLFDIVFFYKEPENILLDVDEEDCVLADANYAQIPNELIDYYDGEIIYDGFQPDTGLVEIVPSYFLSFPDSSFNVPVRLSDFNINNASLSGMDLQLLFNETNISYQDILNINPILPEDQWIISQPGAGQLLCSWTEPNSQNVLIPDETIIFELVFEGISSGTSIIQFDSVACEFIHQHNGEPQNMYANFTDAEAEIVEVPNPPPGTIEFDPDLYVTYPDSIIHVPVVVSGFSDENSSLSNMSFEVTFNETFLEFQSTGSFGGILPEDQWTVNAGLGSISYTWDEPGSQNVIIPEGSVVFEIEFKAIAVGNTTLDFNPAAGIFLHQFYDYTLEFSAGYGDGGVQIYDNTLPLPGLVEINPDYYETNPDSVISLPIVLSGFDQENSSLSDIELYLDFNDQIIEYQSAVNFSDLLPGNQWAITYDDLQSRMICIWDEPAGQNVEIPDNTTIFELEYQAIEAGQTQLEFDSASCVYWHELLGDYYQIPANHNGANVVVEELPPPTPGEVEIIPDSYSTFPDSSIAVPVVVSGFNLPDNTLSDMELHLEFDDAMLAYQSVQNFGTTLPENQWTINYDQVNHKMICIWDEPATQNISIPDNTTVFELVFKAIDLGQSDLEFDQESCIFIHQINGTNQYGSATYGNATVEVTELPPPPPGLVEIVPESYNAFEDSVFNVPVLASGFSEPNAALSDIELYIDFNDNIIGYEMAENFNSLLPADEWSITYDQVNSRMACIWDEPNSMNVSIPDGSTLFELVFKGVSAGTSPLDFDEEACMLIHQQFSGQLELEANFNSATATIQEYVIPGVPKVKIIPEYIEEYSGITVDLNIVYFGFNLDSTTIAAAEFYIDFDTAVVAYVGVDNFWDQMPENQWFYSNPSDTLGRFSCNWVEPSLQNISVPDSTLIMTLHFMLEEDETPVAFDDQACLFVHVDEQFNQYVIDVQLFDGYIKVLPNAVEENLSEGSKNWLTTSYQTLHVKGVTGFARIFNLNGQIVANKKIAEGANEIRITHPGVYIVTVLTEEKMLLSRKVIIN